MPPSGASSANDGKYPAGPDGRICSRMPGSTENHVLRTSTSPSAGASTATSTTRKSDARTAPSG